MSIIIHSGYDVYFYNKLFYMMFSKEIKSALLNASSKALATSFNDQLNVVPVSSVEVKGDEIWLIDYFFNKTKSNFLNNPNVALTFWTDTNGYQVKAKVNYLTVGENYEIAKEWISEIHPERMIKGLLILEIDQIFNISIN